MRIGRLIIEERPVPPLWIRLVVPIVSVLLGLFIGSFLIMFAKVDPFKAYYYLFYGAWGSKYFITETLVKMSPLLFTGLAVDVAFTARFWNIGMEGQLYVGALASVWVGLTFTNLSSWLVIPLALVVAFLAGAMWALLAGFLKYRLKANEVVTTIMMNYVMILLVSAIVHGPWRDPRTFWPSSPIVTRSAFLPVLIKGTRFHLGVVIALVAAVVVYIILWKTTWGYSIRAVGANPKGANYAGINVVKTIVLTTMISGGIAGLAGFDQALGVQHQLIENISPGYGFMGVAVGLLSRLHPIGTIVSAVFFASLITGSEMMQRVTGVPVGVTYALQGIVLIVLLATMSLEKYRIKLLRRDNKNGGIKDGAL